MAAPLPNYTPFPNVVIDQHIREMTGSELKVYTYILRRTFGFQKDHDAISYDQFLNGIVTRDGRRLDYGCIKSSASLKKALDSLEERGLIWVERRTSEAGDNDTTIYGLVFADDEGVLYKLKNGVLQNLKDGTLESAERVLQKSKRQEKEQKKKHKNGNRYTKGRYKDDIETGIEGGLR